MKSQQQAQDLELQDYEEEEEEEDQEYPQEMESSNKGQRYTALATLFALALVLFTILLVLKIASSLEEIPIIYMQYSEEASTPLREERNGRYIQLQQIKPSFDAMVEEVEIMPSSLENLIEVEGSNAMHRNFQQTMRRIEAENAHMRLDKHRGKPFSPQSSMTFDNYLQALDLLQLNTFPANQFSNEYGTLSNQERLYYNQKYDLHSTNSEHSICVVLTLTREGLQNGGYYLALRSIFQQEYSSFRVVVIDNPEMKMREEVQKLVRELGRSKITLLERVEGEETMETSFFIQGAIGRYCKDYAMTMLLRDTGELIGRQVFNVINKVYQQRQPQIIFTHYLLEPFNPLRQSTDPCRYKIQLYPQDLAQSRTGPYRTKYLKIYRTDVLLRLQDRVFQRADGHWRKDLFQASLQFSLLQLSCGNYHLINEIMYMASKYDLESPLQILDARRHQSLLCLQSPLLPHKNQSPQLQVHP